MKMTSHSFFSAVLWPRMAMTTDWLALLTVLIIPCLATASEPEPVNSTPPQTAPSHTDRSPVQPVTVKPDYVRIVQDSKSNRMEVKVASFILSGGQIVDLFGVVHLGDATYYQEVDRRLAAYDAVLFELVGNPQALQHPQTSPDQEAPLTPPHPLRGLQKGIGNLFKLTFQLEQVNYTKANFVHADATTEEFAKMQEQRGESMLKLLLASLQMSSDPALQEKFKDANEIGLADLVMLFYSEKSMQRIKLIFARLLAENENFLDEKILSKNNAIIQGRNEVALKKLKQVLIDPQKKRVAIFYGAGHMPSMEQELKDEWKATLSNETWLSAWTMPAKAKQGS